MGMQRWSMVVALLLACSLLAGHARSAPEPEDTTARSGRIAVDLFWSEQCPHCRNALEHRRAPESDLPWLVVRTHEVTRNPAVARRYVEMAEARGEQAQFVPALGPSLGIPEKAKPSSFRRVRALVHAARWSSMLAGTIVLAAAANSYELLCTAGYPMVYTRILTLQPLGTATFYGYLALYNLIYALPLLAIMLTLHSRVSQATRARRTRAQAGGIMMLELGLLLLYPAALDNLWIATGLLAVAIAASVVIVRLDRRRAPEASR